MGSYYILDEFTNFENTHLKSIKMTINFEPLHIMHMNQTHHLSLEIVVDAIFK
jgi:hypothetical protein